MEFIRNSVFLPEDRFATMFLEHLLTLFLVELLFPFPVLELLIFALAVKAVFEFRSSFILYF